MFENIKVGSHHYGVRCFFFLSLFYFVAAVTVLVRYSHCGKHAKRNAVDNLLGVY